MMSDRPQTKERTVPGLAPLCRVKITSVYQLNLEKLQITASTSFLVNFNVKLLFLPMDNTRLSPALCFVLAASCHTATKLDVFSTEKWLQWRILQTLKLRSGEEAMSQLQNFRFRKWTQMSTCLVRNEWSREGLMCSGSISVLHLNISWKICFSAASMQQIWTERSGVESEAEVAELPLWWPFQTCHLTTPGTGKRLR